MSSLQPSITTQSGLPPVPPGSTSQVSVTDADAYFATTPRDAEWTAIVDKQVWLNEAYRLLTGVCYDPTRDCCGRSFADAWISANSELALALSKNPNAIIGGGGSTASGLVKRQKLGDLEVEYHPPSTTGATVVTAKYGPTDPIFLQQFPFIGDILGCWMTLQKTSGTRVIARVRS